MHTFSTQTTINASPEIVWETLADIGSIYQWNPGVIESHTTSKTETGPGASRHCDLGGKNYLHEEIAEWQPEKKLTMWITHTNLPLKSADIRFTLQPDGKGTIVTVSPMYELKYGLLGRLFNQIYVESSYKTGMERLLTGLKKFIETEK